MIIKFVLLRSPLLSPHDPQTIIVSRKHRHIRLSFDTTLNLYQRNSVAVRHFQKFFGTLAVTRTMHVSPLNRTLTFICVALRMRAHTRPRFGVTHFGIQAEYLNMMTLSMFSSIGHLVFFFILNTNLGSLVTFGC